MSTTALQHSHALEAANVIQIVVIVLLGLIAISPLILHWWVSKKP